MRWFRHLICLSVVVNPARLLFIYLDINLLVNLAFRASFFQVLELLQQLALLSWKRMGSLRPWILMGMGESTGLHLVCSCYLIPDHSPQWGPWNVRVGCGAAGPQPCKPCLLRQLARCIDMFLELVATLTFPLPGSPESTGFQLFIGVLWICWHCLVQWQHRAPSVCVLFASWKLEGNIYSVIFTCVKWFLSRLPYEILLLSDIPVLCWSSEPALWSPADRSSFWQPLGYWCRFKWVMLLLQCSWECWLSCLALGER